LGNRRRKYLFSPFVSPLPLPPSSVSPTPTHPHILSSLEKSHFTPTSTSTYCPWKGNASYYSINVDGKEVKDAAWYYADPKEKAMNIKDHVAFCKSSYQMMSGEGVAGIGG
jgi:uncharacterized protein (DUF427 family)